MSARLAPPPIAIRAAGIGVLRRAGARDGVSLVLLHGIGSNAGSFSSMIEALDPSLDILAWDAPGYGGSEPLAIASPQPSDYAQALAGVLDALRLERIVLAGHSLGALFAGSFAAAFPERIMALALLSPALGYRVPLGGVLPPHVQGRIDDLDRLGPEAFAASRAARLVYLAETKPEVLARTRAAMASLDPAGYAQAVRALGHGDLLADAADITAPTCVAVGAEDVVTPPAGARELYSVLGNRCFYEEIPVTGHALPQEAPAAVAALLQRLIEEARHG
jgi:pimeloyl-ACP methyl ester carboxylesterase